DPGGSEPSLQRRDRASDRLADTAPMAALLAEPDADVPEGSGRADRGPAGDEGLRPARDPRAVAVRGADRHGAAARGLHARAQGPFGGGAADRPARAAVSGGREGAEPDRGGRVQPAPQDAQGEPQGRRAGDRGEARRGRHCADRAGRGSVTGSVLHARPDRRGGLSGGLLGRVRRGLLALSIAALFPGLARPARLLRLCRRLRGRRLRRVGYGQLRHHHGGAALFHPRLGRLDEAGAFVRLLLARGAGRALFGRLAFGPVLVARAVVLLLAVAVWLAVVAVLAALTLPAISLAAVLPALALLSLPHLVFAAHLALRLAQHPRVVLGMLEEVLLGHAVVGQLRVAGQHQVLVDDLLRRAADLALGTRGVED